jgi:hypothetical protein
VYHDVGVFSRYLFDIGTREEAYEEFWILVALRMASNVEIMVD